MSRVRIHNFSISIDGYGAGPNQTREEPLGVGGESLHDWYVKTAAFRTMAGQAGGETGIDNDIASRTNLNVGAWVLGRNMFGPIRGEWPDESWKGWWGENPPYHCPVFVLTHYPRAPLEMEGGTTFHFVTDGVRAALEQAHNAAGEKDVQIGGGVSVLQQVLRERLVDEMHIAVAPILLGSGEHLFLGIDLPALGYGLTERVSTPGATHLVFAKTNG